MGNWVTVWFELKWTSPATTTTAAAAASASVSAVVYHLSKLDTRSTYTVSPTILNKGKELT
jgi:hypothetical protein